MNQPFGEVEAAPVVPEVAGRDHGVWLVLARNAKTQALEVHEQLLKREALQLVKSFISSPDYGPEAVVKIYRGCKNVELKTQVQTTVSF